MIMHVLKNTGMDFDYLVGAQLEGFDTMVRMTDEAPLIVIEGDEYLSSTIDRRRQISLIQRAKYWSLISGNYCLGSHQCFPDV